MNLSQYKSTKLSWFILLVLVVILVGVVIVKRQSLLPLFSRGHTAEAIKLPTPTYKSNTSIEEALKQRRSIRQYKNDALSLREVAQLLWAAQGVTSATGFRTAPSAGGLYPLEIYVVSGNVQDLPAGVYHYLPKEHALELMTAGDKRNDLAKATHEQEDVKAGAIDLVITGIYKKSNEKYGNRGERFVDMEVGHAAENIYLQAVSLGLGTVGIGAFDETAAKQSLNLPKEENPIYVMPVGKP